MNCITVLRLGSGIGKERTHFQDGIWLIEILTPFLSIGRYYTVPVSFSLCFLRYLSLLLSLSMFLLLGIR